MSDNKITIPQCLLAAKATHDKQHQFDNIYYFICRQDWIEAALSQVLSNKGSGTAGIDRQTLADLDTPELRTKLVQTIQGELKHRTYTPTPVRRAYIPKSNGKRRPLGIPTIKDRVVQCLLKMLLEPIYESDFLDCSAGFRPMRRTMDCIATCYTNITTRAHYYWVIEGDIEGCFDHIHHRKLMQTLQKRISDRHILELVNRFLNAGIMEGVLFRRTDEGVPQGGIFSPLLANIYLHELDRWWYENYHLNAFKRRQRRVAGLGNYILSRYADDFIVLCNGSKQSAEDMKGQLQQFLRNELHLELSMGKTQVTHVQEGFDFLGFHLQYVKHDNRESLSVKPTLRNIDRLKDKIRRMTSEDTHLDNDYAKLQAINAILRGWSGYYKHVSSSRIFSALDFWTDMRVLRWLSAKHKLGIMTAVARFKRQQTPTLKNIGIQFKEKEFLWLYKMAKEHHTPYHRQSISNPFITSRVLPLRAEGELSDLSTRWSGIRLDSAWRDVRFTALERDHYRCTNTACGSTQNLDVHHIIPRTQRPDLTLSLDNLTTLCEGCHIAAHGTHVLDSRTISFQSRQDSGVA